jgi:hypothetical protein
LWPSGYWSPGYWSPGYWSGDTVQEPLSLPSIIKSIHDRVAVTTELVDALLGGFWTGPPDPEANDNLPYAVLTRIGGRTVARITSAVPPEIFIQGPVKAAAEDIFQVTVIGEDFDVLDQIHDAWEDNFHSRMDPLVIRRRLFRSLWNAEPTYDFGTVNASPEGKNLVVYRWEFTVLTTLWER